MMRVTQTASRLTLLQRVGLMIMLGLLASVVVSVYQRQSQSSLVSLLGELELTQREINEALACLSKSKLETYVVRDRQLLVPRTEVTRYMAVLAEHGVFNKDLQFHQDEALRNTRLLESERDRHQRIQHAREKDLGRAICRMEGIEDAFVQFDEAEERGLHKRTIVSASIGVLPVAGQSLDRQKIETICRLVSGARIGLEPARIAVTDLRTGVSYSGDDLSNSPVPMAEEYLRVKLAVEREWTRKVREVLQFAPPVQVVVGIELQSPVGTDSVDQPLTNELIRPERIAVSVAVPTSYLHQVWRSRTGRRRDGELMPPSDEFRKLAQDTEERIRESVSTLITSPTDPVSSTVRVTLFDDITAPASGPSSGLEQIVERLRQHPLLVAFVLVLCGLSVILQWKSFRRHTTANTAESGAVVSLPAKAGVDTEALPETLSISDELDEQQLKATLADLVRRDPDRAAKVLHRWIARAS